MKKAKRSIYSWGESNGPFTMQTITENVRAASGLSTVANPAEPRIVLEVDKDDRTIEIRTVNQTPSVFAVIQLEDNSVELKVEIEGQDVADAIEKAGGTKKICKRLGKLPMTETLTALMASEEDGADSFIDVLLGSALTEVAVAPVSDIDTEEMKEFQKWKAESATAATDVPDVNKLRELVASGDMEGIKSLVGEGNPEKPAAFKPGKKSE